MEKYDSLHPVNGFFGQDIIDFTYGITLIYTLNSGFKTNIGFTLCTSFDQAITFYTNEFPKLDSTKIKKITQKLLYSFTKSSFINLYEKIKNYGYVDNSEIMEFFRHIRNASAHNGFFNIKNGNIRYVAKWRSKEIIYDLNGTNLFEFLAIGDFILLLQDIDKYINGNNSEIIKKIL